MFMHRLFATPDSSWVLTVVCHITGYALGLTKRIHTDHPAKALPLQPHFYRFYYTRTRA